MKVFRCVIDDGDNAYVIKTVAKDEKELLNVYGGNGEFLKIEDVTESHQVDVLQLENDLKTIGYSNVAIGIITSVLKESQENVWGK